MGNWPVGVDKRVLQTVDSTMSEAARIAPTLTQPTWILGLTQTAGRARRGRDWVDPVGNFAATLVQRPSETPDKVALRSFVAALALRDALVGLTGLENAFALKWPNDVLLNGGKLSGILLESTGQGGRISHLSVGIGVNLSSVPVGLDLQMNAFPPVSLRAETGVKITPEQFLDVLAPAYAHWEMQFVTYGFAPIRTEWLRHATRLGEIITARTTTTEITGTFETVDDTGAVVLKDAKGRHHIPAADIFFERA